MIVRVPTKTITWLDTKKARSSRRKEKKKNNLKPQYKTIVLKCSLLPNRASTTRQIRLAEVLLHK